MSAVPPKYYADRFLAFVTHILRFKPGLYSSFASQIAFETDDEDFKSEKETFK
jgi:hypothetical protein